jgi:hypothetical protein
MPLHLLPFTSTQSASFNDDRITRSSFLVPNPFDASGASFPFPFSLCLSHLGGPTACRSPSLKQLRPCRLSIVSSIPNERVGPARFRKIACTQLSLVCIADWIRLVRGAVALRGVLHFLARSAMANLPFEVGVRSENRGPTRPVFS